MILESSRIHGFAIQIHRDTIPRYEFCNLNKNTCIFPENKPPSHNKNTSLPWRTGDGGLGGGGGGSGAKNIFSDIYPFTRLKLHVFSQKTSIPIKIKHQLPWRTGDGGLGGGGGGSGAENILSNIYPFTRLKLHVFSQKTTSPYAIKHQLPWRTGDGGLGGGGGGSGAESSSSSSRTGWATRPLTPGVLASGRRPTLAGEMKPEEV